MSKSKANKDKEIMLQKLITGHFIEKIPEDCKKKVCYVLQGHGLWEVRKNRLGTFTSQVEKFQVPGLIADLEESWELNVPRIPAKILVQIVSFFRKIHRSLNSEVFVQVFYDWEKKEYFPHVPQQTVSGASVRYTNEFEDDAGKTLVFEIHSHNTMGAFFSGTDDADEKSDRFFGVVGKINQYYPEMLIRLVVGGRKQSVDVDELFDIDADENYFAEVFPAEWISKVNEQRFKVRRYRGGRKVYVPTGSPYQRGGQQLVLIEGEEDDNVSDERGSFYGSHWSDEVYGDKPPTDSDEDWYRNLLIDGDDENGVPDWRKGGF
jgi:PRTRC genetic system protein A